MSKVCSCPAQVHRKKESASIFSLLLIVLVPKCPFCLLAYSSALGMCGAAGLSGSTIDWSMWMTLALTITTLGLVLYNYKGKRTFFALSLILIGSLFILSSKFFYENLIDYYIGTAFLFWGVWVNGSFVHFYKKWSANRTTSKPYPEKG